MLIRLLLASGKRSASAAFVADDASGSREEAWNLKDVVFIEEAKALTAGTVVMVDGAYCAVAFPDKDGKIPEDTKSLNDSCRLLRKDELQIFKPGSVVKSPECHQHEPKRVTLHYRAHTQVLDMAVDGQGLKLLIERGGRPLLCSASLRGKVEQECPFPTSASAFMGRGACKPRLINYGEVLLRRWSAYVANAVCV